MATKTLSSEISALITELEELAEQQPTNEEINLKIQDLYDTLQEAEGKEWDEQTEDYKVAKSELENAKTAVRDALDNLSNTSNAISKTANAMEKILSAINFLS